MNFTSRVCGLAAAAALCACPSRSSGPSVPQDHSVADAGPDQVVFRGARVSLDGRRSAATTTPSDAAQAAPPLRFQWSQLEGPVVALSDDRSAQPAFDAPHATTTLRFSLTVSAGLVPSPADEVIVLVEDRAPTADAGPDQVAATGAVVTLAPLAWTDPDGDPLTATWYQRGGPPVSLSAHATGTASFTAPATPAVLEFGLIVTDGERSAESPVRVLVVDPGANWPPVVQAGMDREVPRRAVVTLAATAQDRESDPLTWAWTQLAGTTVSLLHPDSAAPSFVAPEVDADLEFQVAVADALAAGTDRIAIRVRNQAPVVARLGLSPPDPVATTTLVAQATTSDADRDPLTLTWAWTRNGAPVAGAAGDTLAPGAYAKGDVVAVTLRASDGTLDATAVATVTIGDAPAVLTVTAPQTATWGQPYTFTVMASDPDGDAVGAPVLRRGPAGMAISASGEGTWTPTLPMFDRALDVTFEVGLATSAAASVERTVRLVDAARSYPLRRSGIELPASQAGLVAFDPDGGGTASLLVASRSGFYELARDGAGYAQRWMYPFALEGGAPTSVEAGDVDGDGRPELFLSTAPSVASAGAGWLTKLDGRDRLASQSTDLGCVDLELGDVDRDGKLELVCLAATASGGAQSIHVLDAADLSVMKWRSADLPLGGSLALGNVDGDAALEIVTSGGYVFDGVTHESEWVSAKAFGVVVDTGDLDGDGVEEIVGIEGWSFFRVFDAVLKAPRLEQSNFDSDALLVADLDGDRRAEIVVGDGQWGNVTAWRYQPATRDLAKAFALNSQDHGVMGLALADLDGDGALELAWGSGATSSGADVLVVAGVSPAAVEWRTAGPSQLDGPFLGAVAARTAPGAAPALLFEVPRTDSGYAGARLVRLDPSGAVTLSPELGSNWARAGALAAADYDADGVDEAFFAAADLYDGFLAVRELGASAAAWTSAAGTGAGAAVVATDLNGDGAADLLAITREGKVVASDVRGSKLLFTSTTLGAGVDVAATDLDGDGAPELVALSIDRLVLFRRAASGSVGWVEYASTTVPQGRDLAVGDCDADGRPELYVLAGETFLQTTTVLRFDAALKRLGSFVTAGAQSLFVEELGPGRKNLVLGVTTGPGYAPTGTALEAVDPVTGRRVWRSPPLLGIPGPNSLGYVDLDGDGVRALAFGTASGMYLTR